MPNDAKLGLVVGVTLVILVAVVFFRKDATGGTTSLAPAPINGVRPATPASPANTRLVTAAPMVREPEKTAPAKPLEQETAKGLPRPEAEAPAANAEPEKPEMEEPDR
jgi:hypothetical protein